MPRKTAPRRGQSLIAKSGAGGSGRRLRFLLARLQRPVRELVPGHNGGDGLPEHVLRKFADPEHDETLIPKFRPPEHIQLVVAGGSDGRFSAVMAGWSFARGSTLVMRTIR